MNDSPIKKLNIGTGKENKTFDSASTEAAVEVQKPAVKEVDMSLVAPTIKAEEMDEPLLRANPQRFVLFPIKYHEVCSSKSSLSRRVSRVDD